jgi:hypothetical protein
MILDARREVAPRSDFRHGLVYGFPQVESSIYQCFGEIGALHIHPAVHVEHVTGDVAGIVAG